MYVKTAAVLLAACHCAAAATAAADSLDDELEALVGDYDTVRFDTSNDEARSKALTTLIQRAASLAKQHPSRGEPLAWKGIVEADLSARERSLGQAKNARKTLEASLAILPNSSAPDAYSTLGAMYANMPGFPLAFGDKKKARVHFQQCLTLDAKHVGCNINYASLLLKQEDFAGAIKHANAGIAGLPRPGRDKADKASRGSAETIITKAKEQLR
jgi:hypothetical protein